MALQHLNEEQIRTWTLEQKDRWWLANVFKGDMPQLTIRSALTGFLLGGVLSATNLYVGAKTGWSLGVGITSVILAFALFKAMSRVGLAREFTILENNAMQSIATAAGYMTAPLISSLAAYMIVTGELLPWHTMMVWNIALSILGVLFAFPMKRRFINDEQQPFPEGRACGVVMDTLHSADAAIGMVKARVLMTAAGAAAFVKFLQSEGIMEWIQHRMLGLKGFVYHVPEHIDNLYYWSAARWGWGIPRLGGVDLRQLTITPAMDLALIGAGGLMGIRAGASLMIGAILNYAVLAPIMIARGDIVPATHPKTGAVLEGVFGLRQITLWSLWPGVAIMVVASFVVFFAKPRVIWTAFTGLFGKRKEGADVLKHIELPMWVFAVGIPVFSLVAAYLGHEFFGIKYWMSLAGVPLMFILSLIAANSTALTGTTPVGAMSKVTQLTYGALDPGNIKTNLMTAGMTAEVVSNASNLLMDIKPGYMLGAKPRQQAIGHVIGIFSGALASVPLFYLLFTQTPEFKAQGVEGLQTEKFPMPSVTVWKAVAEVLTKGIGELAPSVLWAVGAAVLVGVAIEVSKIVTRGRFPLSAVGLGLSFVINFQSSFAMFLGAFAFWALARRYPDPLSAGHQRWIGNQEPICAGVIAGAALVGIADAIVTAFVLR